MKIILLASMLWLSIILSGCETKNNIQKTDHNGGDLSVQRCLRQGGMVSSELPSYTTMASGELLKKLASGTLEMEVVCPDGKQKLFAIGIQQGDIEQQICCQ